MYCAIALRQMQKANSWTSSWIASLQISILEWTETTSGNKLFSPILIHLNPIYTQSITLLEEHTISENNESKETHAKAKSLRQ